MGFIVNYSDIVGIPSKIFSPDPESIKSGNSDQIELIYYIQIDVFHTGYIYLADENVKNKLEILKKKGRSLASFCIKVNRKNLLNELLMNEEREVIAEKILANIIKGKTEVKKIPEKEQSITNIPCFDINFKNILLTEQELEEEANPKEDKQSEEKEFFKEEIKEKIQSLEEIEENTPNLMDESSPMKNRMRSLEIIENEKRLSINVEAIKEKFHIIKQYFGVSEKIKDVEHLNNQSMQPLDFLFPEIEKTEDEILKANKTVLDKSENQDKRHHVKLISYDPSDPDLQVFHSGSDLLTQWLKKKVKFNFF